MKNAILKVLIAGSLLLCEPTIYASQENSLIACQNKTNQAVKAMVVVIGDNPLLKQVTQIATFDLAFTDQIAPEVKASKEILSKKMLKKFYEEDYSLCIQLKILSTKKDKSIIGVSVKDTETGQALFEKTFPCSQKTIAFDSHHITAALIPVLTGNQSIALSTLAYCEQFRPGAKSICVTDYSCFTKKVILKDNALNIAPSWHNSTDHLFYSHFTKKNSELRCFDFLSKKSRVLCSYDGINMQPTCSQDGKQVVLSMSGNKGNTELYLYDQRLCKAAGKRVYKQLTKNGASNVSPTLMPNGDVIFCSDFETGSPQIYQLMTKSGNIKRITNRDGYCAGPSYHEKSNTVIYSRLLNGNFQLFSVNLNDKKPKEKQITSSQGDKLDPSWSPCGRYVAFTYDYVDAATKKRVPQVAVLNYHSGIIRILTKDAVPKSFVSWTNRTYYQA